MTTRVMSVVLVGNSASLTSTLARAGASVNAFQRSVNSTASSGGAGLKILSGGALAVGASLAYSVVKAAQFEQRMHNVVSLSTSAGLSTQQLAQQYTTLSGQVLNLSRTVPQSANLLAEGLYSIASSGFAGAQGLTVLKASALAASAGLSTTQDSAQAITAVLNAYGLSASDASAVSDTLFQTVNFGVISFPELTHVVADFVGMAAAAKVPIGDAGAAIATMTRSGLSASESGVSLNNVLRTLIKGSTGLNQASKDLGVSFQQELANPAIGLAGVMKQLQGYTQGNVAAIVQLFPEIRAARGAFALMANDGQTLAAAEHAINDRAVTAGATQRAFAEQMKSTAAQAKLLENNINAAAIQVGEKMLPAIADLLRNLPAWWGDLEKIALTIKNDVMPGVRDFVSAGQDLVATFAALLSTSEPVLKVLGEAAFGALVVTFNLLGAAVKLVAQGFRDINPTVVLTVATLITVATVGARVYATLSLLIGLIRLVGVFASIRAAFVALTATMAANPILTAVIALTSLAAVVGVFGGKSRTAAGDANALADAIGNVSKNAKVGVVSEVAKEIVTTGSSAADVSKLIDKYHLSLTAMAEAVTGSRAGLEQFGHEMKSSGVSTKDGITILSQLQQVQDKYNQALGITHARQQAASASQQAAKDANQQQAAAAQLATTWTTKQKNAVNAFFSAEQDLTKAQAAYDTALSKTGETVAKQFPLFDKLDTSINVVGADLIKNILAQAQAAANMDKNISILVQRGIGKQALQALVAQGPQYVQAVAGMTAQQFAAFNQAYAKGAAAQNHLAATEAKTGADATAGAAYQALQAQKGKVNSAAHDVFVNTVAANLATAYRIATSGGGTVAANYGAAATGAKATVLRKFLDGLDAPTKAAVEKALDDVRTGRVDINTELSKIQGKKISIDVQNNATGALNQISNSLATLRQAAISAGFPDPARFAALAHRQGLASGGRIPGHDPSDSDSVPAMLTRGEWVINRRASARYGDRAMAAVNSGRARIAYAAGGQVAGDPGHPFVMSDNRFFETIDLRGAETSLGSMIAGGLSQFSGGPIVSYAKQWLGVPYVFGGTQPSGWDCSGFTGWVYKHTGHPTIPRTSEEQFTWAKRVPDHPGALVFYDEGGDIGHVGISLGGGMMIDAPHTGAVTRIEPLFGGVAGFGDDPGAGHGVGAAITGLGAAFGGFAAGGKVGGGLRMASGGKVPTTSRTAETNWTRAALSIGSGALSSFRRRVPLASVSQQAEETRLQSYMNALNVAMRGLPGTVSFSKHAQLDHWRQDIFKSAQILANQADPFAVILSQQTASASQQAEFNRDVLSLAGRGHGVLAQWLSDQGWQSGLDVARQIMAQTDAKVTALEAQIAAQNAASTAAASMGNVLKLLSLEQPASGGFGVLGLSSQSGLSVADTLQAVFGNLNTFSGQRWYRGSRLASDITLLNAGKQPSGFRVGGIVDSDRMALVHAGEGVLRPEAMRVIGRDGFNYLNGLGTRHGTGSTSHSTHVSPGAISVHVSAPGADPHAIEAAASRAANQALARLNGVLRRRG